MLFRSIRAIIFTASLVACASAEPKFNIRDDARPSYSDTIAADQIDAFVADGGVLLDVRLAEDFHLDPRLIPGALRVDPETGAHWQTLDKGTPIAVYCVKGKWVSQKVAHHISGLGIETYSLAGGLVAYDAMAEAREE
ncbi:MAG: rhodanese-like domain-containing protein [Pseudomonadota bacterium]